MPFRLPLVVALSLGCLATNGLALAAAESSHWIWFEAETAGGDTNLELSGGAMRWLAPGASLERPIDVPSPGTYTLWIRKFWNPQGFRWRVGPEDSWKDSRQQNLADLVQLDGDAGRRVGWAQMGSVDLTAGVRTFRLEVLEGDRNTTAYDCFLLTRDPFVPRGALKPGERRSIHEPGWFAFEPEADRFADSPIDLRALNEARAGDGGYLRADGEELVHERTGKRVRFWAVNVGMGLVGSARAEIDRFARAQAKRGVNLVRVHGPIYAGQGPQFGRVDTNRIHQVQYLVQALKREGIYTALSIYFPLWVRLGPENPGFPGYQGGHPFALLYFHPDFQELYRRWWRDLLLSPNPHGEVPLKDEPAVAIAEMYNEDSTLFWTFNPAEGAKSNLPDPQRHRLEQRFANWLRTRYPGQSLEQIRAMAWNGLATPQDDPAADRLGFRRLWEISNARTPRDQDTARFLTELMTNFHRETYRYFRETLGYRGLIYGSNWRTASEQYLDPLDKLANDVGDVFDRHGYFGGLHDGPNSAWNVERGQTYDDRSALKLRRTDGTADDFANPIFDLVYQRKPSFVTEINWPLPNRFRADMILAGAAYGALQGSDGICWFAAGNSGWDGLPGKFSIQTPVVQGQFPGAALLFRRGLVQTAPRIVEIQLGTEDLYRLRGTPLPSAPNFDQLRGQDVPPGGTFTNVAALDSLAFLVGRVGTDFVEGQPQPSRFADLSAYIDRSARRVRSQTGELEWDWGRGLLTVRAPAAQGVAGFLASAGILDLPGFRFETALEYGALLAVALDGKPIAESGRVLVQVASEERPYRWATDRETGRRTITHRGTLPLLVREFSGTIRLTRGDAAGLKVTPLDYDGYPLAAEGLRADRLELAADVPYYLIEER